MHARSDIRTMKNAMTPLFIFLVDVYSGGAYAAFDELCRQYAHTRLEEKDDYDPNLLGSCQLFQAMGQPTIAYLYTSFIPGRPYEKNAIAQRFVSDIKHDIDLRGYIKNDTQAARDVNVRKALEDVREQLDLKNTSEVVIFTPHARCFEERGSYFEILRKFFVIEQGRSFSLHLRIDKKYQDFIDLSRTTDKIKKIEHEEDFPQTTFDIPMYAEIVMNKRMRR